MLAEENDLFNLEDGVKWLEEIYKIKEKYWLSLFTYLPKNILNERKKRSAIISLLQASLSKVNKGEILINQKYHFQPIMIKLK